jgi:hypothetical protein
MPNSLEYVGDWLTTEGLRLLTNKLQVAQFFNTEDNNEFEREFAVGDTVNKKLPQRFLPRRNTLGYSPQPLNRITTPITIDKIAGIDFEWDSFEKALKLERSEAELKREYLDPAMAQIAQIIDSDCAEYAAQNTPNVVGVLGTDPTAMSTFGQARQRLVEYGMPAGGEKGVIIAPQVNTSMVDSLKGLFQADDELSRQYKEGTIGRFQGFKWYESMSLKEHTAGTWAGAVTVAGASQSGSSLLLNCTSGDTFKKGDKISIDNVYGVNPMTRAITTRAVDKQFTITADVTASAATVTVSIYPSIYGPGSQYQNVDALPANTAAVTLWPGTSSPSGKVGKVNLAIHKDAFALVGVKLEVPKQGAEIAKQMRDPDSGLSVRFIRQFDPQQSKMINRFDVVYGFGRLHAEACSVAIAGA